MLHNINGRTLSQQHAENVFRMLLKPQISARFFYKMFPRCYVITKEKHSQSNTWKML